MKLGPVPGQASDEIAYEWLNDDEIALQRECPDCEHGLLYYPVRYCPTCSGSGFLVRIVKRGGDAPSSM